MSPAAQNQGARKSVPRRGERKPVVIKQIGADHWAGGKGNVKQLILGGPDVGKTRYSSAYPRPLWLACEPLEVVAASIAGRKIDYEGGAGAPHIVEIESSDGLFDTLDWLDTLPAKVKAGELPKYQTAVLDTLDGLLRRLKSEWAESEGASMFTGREAWAFLEGKLTLTIERLLNLDMNVLVLCHLRSHEEEVPTSERGVTQKITTYEPFLQGQIKDSIFHDFNLVGLMRKELVGDREVRGISYDPTHQFPFLKDHFHLSPPDDPEIRRTLGRKFWPITLDDGTKGGDGSPESFIETNYATLWQEITSELDTLPESGDVEEIPQGGEPAAPNAAPANLPGGPTAGAADVKPQQPAAKKAAPAPAKKAAAPPAKKAAPAAPAAPKSEAPKAEQAPTTPATGVASAPVPEVEQDAQQPAEAPETVEPQGEATLAEAVANAEETLGGEVVGGTDGVDGQGEAAEATEVAHTQDEGRCPICGESMEKEQPDLVQLSRLKHRTLVLPDGRKFHDTGGCCYKCYTQLNEDKASKTGLYAESA